MDRGPGLFIDVSNLYYCVGRKFNRKIDYNKYVTAPNLVIQKAYGTQLDNEARSFIKKLEQCGYETEFIKTTKNRITNLNVNIVVDVINHLDELTEVILGTASRDMVSFIKFLQAQDVKVTIYACGICNELIEVADNIIEIEETQLENTKTNNTLQLPTDSIRDCDGCASS